MEMKTEMEMELELEMEMEMQSQHMNIAAKGTRAGQWTVKRRYFPRTSFG
jgi:hypothetical protein